MMTPFGTSASLMVVGQAGAAGVPLSVVDFAAPGAAATFGASASFFMLFGYQTRLLVLSPGRYRLRDYFRLGRW